MKKFIQFIFVLIAKIKENQILPLASELTYRLIFALFPFVIFLITLVGFFDIDSNLLMNEVHAIFPEEIARVIDDVIAETVDTRSTGILSSSLIISLFTITTGFRAIMRGINRVYGVADERHAIIRWLYSGLLVLALAFGILASLLVIIFGDQIYALLARHFALAPGFSMLFGLVGILVTMSVMLFTIIMIYRLSCCKKLPIISLIPGAMLTLAAWAISSKFFNIYINNFSRHSLIYGSIASIFLTMLWLNIISAAIIIGAQTNALLIISKENHLADY